MHTGRVGAVVAEGHVEGRLPSGPAPAIASGATRVCALTAIGLRTSCLPSDQVSLPNRHSPEGAFRFVNVTSKVFDSPVPSVKLPGLTGP